jgi:uncharacterized membrane protein YdjX (TVP38/TMEM64 family)
MRARTDLHENLPPAGNDAAEDLFPVPPRAAWRSAAILVLLTIALVALALSDKVHAVMADTLAESQAIIVGYPILGPVLFVALAAVTAMLAFASVAVLLPLAVVTWGEPFSILLLWTGWLLGGALTYCIGRFFGLTLARWLAADSLLHRLERRIGTATPFGVILLFQLALPSEVPGYVLGLVRYSFPKYLLALGLVELLYTLAAVHLGASFVERQAGVLLGIGLAVALFSLASFYLLRRKL